MRAALVLFALGGACASTPGAGRELDESARAFVARYLGVLESGDDAAIRDLFAADGRFAWFTDGALAYDSPEAVVAGRRRYSGARFETSLADVRVVPLGPSHVAVRSSFSTRLTSPGAPPHEYAGVITWILVRDGANEAWRVLSGHTSTPGGRDT